MVIKKAHIIVGLSGGVDSSVAALLLKNQGHDVHGLFMKNWEEDDTENYCSASIDVADAQAVCDRLQIPLHTVNFSAEYWDQVFELFLQEYQLGRTPNPDILCNKEIKFKAFLQYALELGADFIATGHYVKKESTQKDEHLLLRANDTNKDQSYFLYTLGQKQLARSLFPVGDLPKSKVREIAAQAGLITHNKKDSTGICFIGERRFKNFLSKYLPAKPGDIVTLEGNIIGQHDGLMYYTIGQRQGLKIGGQQGAESAPWYVASKDLAKNTLLVVQGEAHPLLYSRGLHCSQLSWVSGKMPSNPLHCTAKTRYRQQDVACIATPIDSNNLEVKFLESQRAITPGQSIVFYSDNICLGGGIIDTIYD